MKRQAHKAVSIFVSSCLFASAQASEHVAGNSCPKPPLNIDFEDETQLQLLKHDFKQFESCIIDFATSALVAIQETEQVLEAELAEDSWETENEEEVLAYLDERLEFVNAQRAVGEQAKQDLIDVVSVIAENVSAKRFNQWGAQTKIAEEKH